MANNLYRLDDLCLLKEIKTYDFHKFHKHNQQYILNDEEYWNNELDSTVWFSGEYKHRLNRVYDKILYNPEFVDYTEKYSTIFSLYLRQGFTFNNLFGILFVAQDMVTEEILISRIITQNEFFISDTKELVNGTFWIQQFDMIIPRTDNNVQVQIAYVTYDDIDITTENIGYINNYPLEFISLISEKPYPDFIRTNIEFDDAHFIKIETYTTENKTLEQSILDYFGVSVSNIKLTHQIKYGTLEKGYKTISVSNDDYTFGPVNIGLNLSEFYDPNSTSNEVNIFVTTEINVDSKTMKRSTSISTDLLQTLNPILAGFIGSPQTINELRLNKNITVTNKVIEQNVIKKLVPILQPTYIQINNVDVIFEIKNISFDNVIESCYLITDKTDKDESQTIMSHKTKEGKFYFDLSEMILNKNTSFKIITVKDSRLVQTGNFILK